MSQASIFKPIFRKVKAEFLRWNRQARKRQKAPTITRNKAAPSAVFTISRAAEMLCETIDHFDKIAEQLAPEDGCLWIYDTDRRAALSFTIRGIESLNGFTADQRR